MENATDETKDKKKNPIRFEWLLPALFKPRSTFQKITAEEKPVWLTPLLVVSFLALIFVLVAAPIRRTIIEMGMNIPENFQYFSTDQQAQFMSAQANRTSPLFLYVFPFLSKLAGIWISWFLLSSLLHLSLTLSGSRANSIRSYNLAGWSLMPIAVRFVVQIFAMLITKTVISSPGLSGFMSADVKGFTAFLSALLGLIDIYLIWQIVLLFIGVVPLSGLSRSKAATATIITLLLLLLLQAVPGLLSHSLSGLSLSTPFYF